MITSSDSWERFEPADGNGIVGMEKILDDGTALDVLGYGVFGEVDEYSWMIRLWDDAVGQYRIIASHSEGLYYNDLEQAYDGLIERVQANFSHLLSNDDEIVSAPEKARAGFLRKAMLCGLAAAISFSMIGMVGCSALDDEGGDNATYSDSIGGTPMLNSTVRGAEHLRYLNDGEHTELAYDIETGIVYYIFHDGIGQSATGYMSPYIGANGNYCRWDGNQIVELD